MWFKRKSKEEKEKAAAEKKAKHVASRREKTDKTNEKIGWLRNKYCLDSRGIPYGFHEAEYNEETDEIELLFETPDTLEGYYNYFKEGKIDILYKLRNDRKRWDELKSNLDKLGLEIVKKKEIHDLL